MELVEWHTSTSFKSLLFALCVADPDGAAVFVSLVDFFRVKGFAVCERHMCML